MNKYARYAVPALIIIVAAIILVPPLFTPEKKKIQRTIAVVKKAVVKKDPAKVLMYIADGYTDSFRHDKASLEKDLKRLFDYSGPLAVSMDNLNIEVDAGKTLATVSFIGKLETGFGNNKVDLISEFCRSDRFRLHLEKIEGTWKVVEAENLLYTYD